MIHKIHADAQQRDAILREKYSECPGECFDGKLHAQTPEGAHYSRVCWYMTQDCPYGIRQRRQLRDYFYNSLTASAIPAIHRNALFFSRRTDALGAVYAWKWQHKPLLLLLGAKGVGKSYAAARAFIRWVFVKNPSDLWRDGSQWQRFANDAARALCWLHIYKVVNDRDAVDEAARAPFLVLDDLASEDATPNAKARVNYIISERYDNLRPTVMTGNLSIKDFVARYGERIFDRVSHFGEVVNCTGENLREVSE